MIVIIDNHFQPVPGKILRAVQARIRDGHFHYYEYEPDNDRPVVHLSDQYPEEMKKWLSENREMLVTKTSVSVIPPAVPTYFSAKLFPNYFPGCMDPDYDDWWTGVVIEL